MKIFLFDSLSKKIIVTFQKFCVLERVRRDVRTGYFGPDGPWDEQQPLIGCFRGAMGHVTWLTNENSSFMVWKWLPFDNLKMTPNDWDLNFYVGHKLRGSRFEMIPNDSESFTSNPDISDQISFVVKRLVGSKNTENT